jgi:hypothetical protein
VSLRAKGALDTPERAARQGRARGGARRGCSGGGSSHTTGTRRLDAARAVREQRAPGVPRLRRQPPSVATPSPSTKAWMHGSRTRTCSCSRIPPSRRPRTRTGTSPSRTCQWASM